MPIYTPPTSDRILGYKDGVPDADVTEDVYTAIRKAWDGYESESDLNNPDTLRKAGETVTTAQNLVAINLEAPSKTLYPVLTPVRNMLPRRSGGTGLQAQWRRVTAISGPAAMPVSPWLREGQRAARMAITTSDVAVPYATFGVDIDVTFEAQNAARGFEDLYAMSGMRALQLAMLQEEDVLLGGNRTVALGVTATPTLAAAGSGATLPAATYSVRVFALTHEGVRNAGGVNSLTGIFRQVTLTGIDGQTYTVNGGSSGAGAAATQAITLGQVLSCSVPAIRGAVAYAWYVGTAGAERLERITTINSAAFSAPLAGTGQTLASITDAATDRSFNNGTAGNNAPAFDGLLYNAFAPTSGSIVTSLATGTAGTGTGLTASGRGTIVEIDAVLEQMWAQFRISPDFIWVSAQEIRNIANRIFGGTPNGLLRATYPVQSDGQIDTGISGINYFSLYAAAANGSASIPMKVHPTLTPGTILFQTQNLPMQYQASGVPQVCAVDCRQDYYQVPWTQTTRRRETGVYSEETLLCYFQPALAVLTNIGNV